jgi:hypothetical protein
MSPDGLSQAAPETPPGGNANSLANVVGIAAGRYISAALHVEPTASPPAYAGTSAIPFTREQKWAC